MAPRPVIALLGGGQLGRMFIENALRYDVDVHVLDPDPHAPCAALATIFKRGDLNDEAAVLAFAQDATVVGIEIEHVSVSALVKLKAAGRTVIPDPEILRTIKDKGAQKEFYIRNGIPTAPFALLGNGREAAAHAGLFPAFLKARTGGYDGRGVMYMDGPTEVTDAFMGPCVLEQRVDIAMELGVLIVRSEKGTQVSYDPVEMVFDPNLNLVDHLRVPARIPEAVAVAARKLAGRVAEAFNAPGVYAVELFLTRSGELLVNETAPRAHNSGHHTIEACPSSQFDQLLRVYMGWPLGGADLSGYAAMVNLVGSDGTGTPETKGLDDVLHIPGTFPHLYGKHETRTGRKMGHVTILAADHHGLDQGIAVVKTHCRVVPRKEHVTSTLDPRNHP